MPENFVTARFDCAPFPLRIHADAAPFFERVADYVFAHGRQYEPGPLPTEILRGPAGYCFRTALDNAIKFPGLYTYCEGFARWNSIAWYHAWLIDPEGLAVDPTWTLENGLRVDVPFYFGVEIPWGYVAEVASSCRERFAVIADIEHGCPLARPRGPRANR
jgi:hypothetical protein